MQRYLQSKIGPPKEILNQTIDMLHLQAIEWRYASEKEWLGAYALVWLLSPGRRRVAPPAAGGVRASPSA